MSASVDPAQALLEIEHALSKRFADPSAAVTHTFLSNGVLSVQISWVTAKATMNILDERCMLNIAFAPNVLNRYAALESAARAWFRDNLSAKVMSRVERHLSESGEIAGCNLAVGVNTSMVDDAARQCRLDDY
jgi:hypothetical protein